MHWLHRCQCLSIYSWGAFSICVCILPFKCFARSGSSSLRRILFFLEEEKSYETNAQHLSSSSSSHSSAWVLLNTFCIWFHKNSCFCFLLSSSSFPAILCRNQFSWDTAFLSFWQKRNREELFYSWIQCTPENHRALSLYEIHSPLPSLYIFCLLSNLMRWTKDCIIFLSIPFSICLKKHINISCSSIPIVS